MYCFCIRKGGMLTFLNSLSCSVKLTLAKTVSQVLSNCATCWPGRAAAPPAPAAAPAGWGLGVLPSKMLLLAALGSVAFVPLPLFPLALLPLALLPLALFATRRMAGRFCGGPTSDRPVWTTTSVGVTTLGISLTTNFCRRLGVFTPKSVRIY